MKDTHSGAEDHAAVLEAVGNETRVAIVKALVDHRRDHPRDPGLSFSALRDRVGMRDSGQFNYHLDTLRGGFVEEGEGEYKLTYAGRKLATALVTEAFSGGYEQGPVKYGTCPRGDCDATLLASYGEGTITVGCDADHRVFRKGLPPMAAAERSMDELLALVTRTLYHDADLASEGICPLCYGEMQTTVAEEQQDGAAPYSFEGVCQRCGFVAGGAAGTLILTDPAVVAFFTDHGQDIREQHPWCLDFITSPEPYTLVSEAPLRIRIDVTLAGDELRVTVAGSAEVVDTEYAATDESG